MPPVRFQVSYQALSTVYSSVTGLVDVRTGYPELGGGLNQGQYFDLTEAEANAISANQVMPLHVGRYRFVGIDSAATAANLLQGNYVGIAPGKSVQNVVIKTAGSGQTPGAYTVTGSGGGGTTQATISVVVGAGGTVTGVSVLTPGSGYTSVPTFTLVTGGTPGTVQAEMAYTVNAVTSFDKIAAAGLRPGILLTAVTAAQVTAGAWVFIQESGIANVNGKAALTAGTPAIGDVLVAAATGVIDDPIQSGNVTFALSPTVIGQAVDVPVGGALFKAQLSFPMQQG